MLREEKPEAFASPEPNPQDGSSKKKKSCRKKKKKINENPNPQPQVCSEPLVVVTPISELKSNEESVTLPDSNNIPTEKKRKKNRNKKKSMINGEEPKPALELGNKMEVEPIEVAKPMTRKRKRKSVQNGAESNEHNIEQAETSVQMSILDREVPPIDKAIAVNNQPASLDELEERYFERQRMMKERKKNYLERKKLKGEVKTNGEEKTKNDTLETLAQRPFDPITEPSTDPAVVMDTHPATPIVAEHKIAKKRHKKRKRKWEGKKTNEHNGKPHQSKTPVQNSISPTTALSTDPTVPINQTIPIDPACHTAAPLIDAVPADPHPATPMDPEQKKKKRKKKGKGGLKSEAVQYSIAETSVQGTKGVTVTNAPNDQHGQSSMLCWACRETNHTIQQCQKLKSLSKDEEVCFFCGEIGHSLGRCSVYIAGGGRLARCLFCNAHGHFSYNCPGNCHDPKGWPVEAESMVQC